MIIMKRILLLLLCVVLSYQVVVAQSPQKMSYQCVVRNAGNSLVASLPVGIRISILQGSSTGVSVYTETHLVNTNANGLATIEIGGGTAVSGSFGLISWANGPYFVKSETDPTGGTSYSISAVAQLLSVPYALYAETSGTPGATGPQGPVGLTGATGPQGPVGLTGATGPQGIQGLTGATGPQGPIGLTGLTGATGPQGIQGLTGATGSAGTNGINGTNGISVTNSAVIGDSLYVTLSNGQTLNTGYVRGPQGIAGTFPNGSAAGEMMYWNGTAWVSVAPGVEGQSLSLHNGTPTWESRLSVGMEYQGGVIAYLLHQGDIGYNPAVQHGLIAAPSDQGTGAEWGCYGISISGADSTAFGTGNQNTIDIMNGCGTANIAARICGDLVLNGYSDWYLPSKDELNKLYLNRLAIGGFAAWYYWSSSETANGYAWNQTFDTGTQTSFIKYGTFYVRAVRAF